MGLGSSLVVSMCISGIVGCVYYGIVWECNSLWEIVCVLLLICRVVMEFV